MDSSEATQSLHCFLTEWRADSPTITVHTSGSTGEPKLIEVEKERMKASARITCEFLGLKSGDAALLCLPLDYIAGKMMVVRALTWGLSLVQVEPSSHPLRSIESSRHIDFAAMVPLQVWQSMQDATELQRLKAIGNLIIGGGAIDDALAAKLKNFPNAVWSTYGMTETLSHIALRRLSGKEATEWYTPLSGVDVRLTEDSCLAIDAPAVCAKTLVTNDIAVIDTADTTATRFRIVGRRDNTICSGGIKIQAEEVERLLRPFIEAPFCITRRKDTILGQAVTLLTEQEHAEELKSTCQKILPKHWVPRHYITVEHIPMTATGKVARKEAEDLVNVL
jgi:O-succinylbenzoic acid--CoA ligase